MTETPTTGKTTPGIKEVTGTALALDRRDVDTDQIIPAAWLKRVERTGFAPGLFGAWRNDPEFVLNRPGADQAKVLVAGANFGCGSSREHAVWALQDFGFQVVVAPSFADIFRGNCISSGLVPAQATEEGVRRLFAELADFAQWRLLEGLDDVALSLRHEAAISAYEGSRAAWLPTLAANAPATP